MKSNIASRKHMTIVVNVAFAFITASIIAGCGKEQAQEKPRMFPIEGGFIDLQNVSIIKTSGYLGLFGKNLVNEDGEIEDYVNGLGEKAQETWLLGSDRGGPEPLTKKSIENAKRILQQNKNAVINTVKMGGYIAFDDNVVSLEKLQSFESCEDIVKVLDSWLETIDLLPIQ